MQLTIPRPGACGLFTGLLMVTLVLCSGCGRPPQVVNDEECFSAVDALWTAVTSKRSDLVEQTATELDRLVAAGNLSETGHESLTEIVEQARATEWKVAAEKLKTFMLGQRKTRT